MTGINRPTLLVVDPGPFTPAAVEMVLGREYAVVAASRLSDAIALVKRHQPAAVLSEVYLGDCTCLDLRRKLDEDRLTSGVPMAIVTNVPALARELNPEFECVDMHFLVERLPPAVARIIGNFQPGPRPLTLSFLLEDGRETIVQTYGLGSQIYRTPAPPWDECLACGRAFHPADGVSWASALDACGSQLLSLLEGCCQLQSRRAKALEQLALEQLGEQSRPLRLKFVGPAESLKIPFEALINPQERLPLAVQHRFSRSLLTPGGSREPIVRSQFLARWAGSIRKVSWLVIGLTGDPDHDVHRIEDELIQTGPLAATLLRKGVQMIPRVILPREASLSRIREELQHGWDIVQITGHCPPPAGGSDSGIVFQSPRSQGMETLTAGKLIEYLTPAPGFLLINCCYGTETYAPALIHSGVGGFMTFRGAHASTDFLEFSREFYDALGQYRDLETATQTTRLRLFHALPRSGIWAAASLVLQGALGNLQTGEKR